MEIATPTSAVHSRITFHRKPIRCVVSGQNTGARPLMTQVQKGDIKVIVPRDFREVEPIFPLKA